MGKSKNPMKYIRLPMAKPTKRHKLKNRERRPHTNDILNEWFDEEFENLKTFKEFMKHTESGE